MNQIIIYRSKDKKTQIDVQFENDTVWLTQQQMAELFGQTKQNISLHINNCFKEKELSKSNCQGFLDSCRIFNFLQEVKFLNFKYEN